MHTFQEVITLGKVQKGYMGLICQQTIPHSQDKEGNVSEHPSTKESATETVMHPRQG